MSGHERIDELVGKGDYRAAVAVCEELGLLARAQQLLEQLLDHAGAGRFAEAQGDTVGALELYLKANEHERGESLRRRLMAELDGEIPRALALFERRGYYLQAAELAESIGRLEQAARLYVSGSSHSRAGRLFERIGRVREAGEAYETALRGSQDDAEANLGLGRVLQRFGRHEEAVPLLSRALGSSTTGPQREAGQRIAYSFFKLRLVEAGLSALERVGKSRSTDIESFMLPFEGEFADLAGAGQGQSPAGAGAGALEGRYRLEQPAPSYFGASYYARDLLADRKVLIHFIPGTAEDNSAFYDELGRLMEPPCLGHVRILAINPRAGFVALRATDGATLLEALESDQPPSALRVRGIAIQVFEALLTAHRRGILHGGLSPAAIGLTAAGVVEVSNWGSRHVERRMATQTAGPESPMVYRAPEATLGRAMDFRADLYSLAAVMVRALTGRPTDLGAREPLGDGWAAAFERFFERALAPDPADRHANHDLFRRELEALPWSEVAHRRPAVATRVDEAVVGGDGPRFVSQSGSLPAVGVVDTVHDRLLDRDVRYLALPPRDERLLSLIDRLDQLSSPECPGLQDVLLSTEDAIILEVLPGTEVADRVASGGPLDTELVLEGASTLLAQLAAAHAKGLGLGTISSTRVCFDGFGFRAPIEDVLLVGPGHDSAAMAADASGFWQAIYVALGGQNPADAGPSRLVGLLRARGLLAPQDHDALAAAAPAGVNSLVGLSDWFDDLQRVVAAHAELREALRLAIDSVRADHPLTPLEVGFLRARAEALGLSDTLGVSLR